jgi:hypothetical protein
MNGEGARTTLGEEEDNGDNRRFLVEDRANGDTIFRFFELVTFSRLDVFVT